MHQPRVSQQFVRLLALCFGFAMASRIGAQTPFEHAPDANATNGGPVYSISILPTPHAPFTATVVTDTVTIQPDGSKRTLHNSRFVARDSDGRVFQERRYLTPTGDTELTPLSMLQFEDPIRHRMTTCDPSALICTVYEVNLQRQQVTPASASLTPGNLTREDLGHQTIATLDVVGSRETTTIPAGLDGSPQPPPMVKEFWYSPYLGINIITHRSDPRISATQDFRVENIDLHEPDRRTFDLPGGYRIVDTTQSNAPTYTSYTEVITCPFFGACTGVWRPIIIRRRR
jgi:hypothetical protein